jgi:hypothetical protein
MENALRPLLFFACEKDCKYERTTYKKKIDGQHKSDEKGPSVLPRVWDWMADCVGRSCVFESLSIGRGEVG